MLIIRGLNCFITAHYNDVIMSAIVSQITSLTIVYSTVYTGADERKRQSSASLAFVWGIQRWTVNSSHKWPATRKMFPFDDVIMTCYPASMYTIHVVTSSEIAKTVGSTCIRRRSDAKVSDRCLIHVDPNVFANWNGIETICTFFNALTLLWRQCNPELQKCLTYTHFCA